MDLSKYLIVLTFRIDSVLLHDSMPSLSAVHNQSVIEDSDEHLTDHP